MAGTATDPGRPGAVRYACPYCLDRENDARALRGTGTRGKQLGALERRILADSGAPERRIEVLHDDSETVRLADDPTGGFPLLVESGGIPQQTAMRAAAARLQKAGLVTLLRPTVAEARRWIDSRYSLETRPDPDPLQRRLRLSRFSWRTLLGDEIVNGYPRALRDADSRARIRWDRRLDEALERARARCICATGGRAVGRGADYLISGLDRY